MQILLHVAVLLWLSWLERVRSCQQQLMCWEPADTKREEEEAQPWLVPRRTKRTCLSSVCLTEPGYGETHHTCWIRKGCLLWWVDLRILAALLTTFLSCKEILISSSWHFSERKWKWAAFKNTGRNSGRKLNASLRMNIFIVLKSSSSLQVVSTLKHTRACKA